MSKKIIDFIDLTMSITDITNRSIHLENEVINLDSDDSFLSETKTNTPPKKDKPIQSIKKKKKSFGNLTIQAPINNYGECPICMDKLGENPLAATICGHVFCMKCLERSLLRERRCPTCRCSLRRKAGSYHPLYLNNNN